jgi:hypothetical protein
MRSLSTSLTAAIFALDFFVKLLSEDKAAHAATASVKGMQACGQLVKYLN